MKNARRLTNSHGYTLIELLLALFLTGILATGAFRFYAEMHIESKVQFDISDMQQVCRGTMQEVTANLRKGGYMLTGHPAFETSGDTLAVYFSLTQPVDTTLYFLEEYTADEYSEVPGRPQDLQIWKLMRQVNSGTPQVFADFITSFTCTALDSANAVVSVTSIAACRDEDFQANGGFRETTLSERVNIRNIS